MYSLRIDTRNNRLYLSKSIVEKLGYPEFMQMWIRRSDMMIFISPAASGIRTPPEASGEYCLYSKTLLEAIRAQSGNKLSADCSYKLKGEEVGTGICFPMESMERVE